MSTARTVELRLGLVCNQHCHHCSRHTTRRDPRDEGDPLGRLRDLLASGAREVVLTGGEPTLSPHLLAAVRHCTEAGAVAVLETNGLMLASPAVRQRLYATGLREVRLHWPAADAATYAAVTRDPSGFLHVVAALQGLQADGFAVDLTVPVLAANVAQLDAIAADPRIAGVRAVRWQTWRSETRAGVEHHHPHPRQWQSAMSAAWQTLRARGIAPLLAPGEGMPACLLDQAEAVPWLVARTPHAAPLPAACDGCVLQASCAGPPRGLLEAHPAVHLQPIGSQRIVRKIEALHPHSQPDDNYLRTITETMADGRRVVREVLLRVVQQCNERCRFCWVDFEAPACPDDMVEAALAEVAAAAPGAMLSLTGGEPLLRKDLAELVQRGRQAGAWAVQLQTNATLVTAESALGLAQAGLTHALVGLHAADAAGYGAITTTPQLFERALAGIAALLAAGVEVTVNCVLTAANADAAEQLPGLLAGLASPDGRRPLLSFAAAADIAGGPLDAASLPRLSVLAPPLRKAIERCIEVGQPFAGLAHPCGVPPCILGADLRYYPDLLRWQVDEAPLASRPGACQSCVLSAYCPGLRPAYVQRYGDAELTPLLAWPALPQPPLPPVVAPLAPPGRPLHAVVVGAGAMGIHQAQWLAATDPAARIALLSRRAPLERRPDGLPPQVAVHPVQALGQLAGIDIVSVCTATADRGRDVGYWLSRIGDLPAPQRPWLLVEKPLAGSVDLATRLHAEAAERGVVMLVQHTVVASPAWRAVKTALGGRTVRQLSISRCEPARRDDAGLDLRERVTQHLLHEAALVLDALAGNPAPMDTWTVTSSQFDVDGAVCRVHVTMRCGESSVMLSSQLGGSGVASREVVVEAATVTALWREAPGERMATVTEGGVTTPLAADTGEGRAAAVLHIAACAQRGRSRPGPPDDPLCHALSAARAVAAVGLASRWLATWRGARQDVADPQARPSSLS